MKCPKCKKEIPRDSTFGEILELNLFRSDDIADIPFHHEACGFSGSVRVTRKDFINNQPEIYRIQHTDADGYFRYWQGEASSAAEAIEKAKAENSYFRNAGELYIRVKTYNGYGGWRKVKNPEVHK